MQTCSNCGAQFGCSCKRRVASDGASACQSCIAQYENSLEQKKKAPVNKTEPLNVKTSGRLDKV